MMGKKNYLGAANRKMLSYGCTNTGGATLYIISYTQLGGFDVTYRNHDHFGVHQALRIVAGSPKAYF